MDELFEAAGELAAAYDAVDWASTPLGDPSSWSLTLRSTVGLVLQTEFPISLFWGPEFVTLYNASFVSLIGDKHPGGLGRRAQDVFHEAWEQIGPWMRAALEDDRTTYIEDALVPLERHGFLEECYFTFSYSPVGEPDGVDRGVIDIAHDTTRSVVTQRRLQLLGRLSELLAGVENPQDVPTQSLLLLREAVDDMVEVDLRPADADGRLARRDLVVEGGPDGVLVRLALRSRTDDRPVGLDRVMVEARPSLVVRPSPRLPLDDDHLLFLRLVAGTLGQALDRVEALVSERRIATAEREMSETLQRSLLGTAQSVSGVQVAVRYQPAVDLAEIGGDWHDSFLLADGRLWLAIGDVAGHDRRAAAAMAQTRNLLRGIAYTLDGGPAATLVALDAALVGLDVGSFATGILAALSTRDDEAAPRRLTWSNAGHPPPVLLAPDGTARLLSTSPELLLGVRTEVERSDHVLDLEPGSTVLLFTDGLIERRSQPLDVGLARVLRAMTGRTDLDPEALCDHVLEQAHPEHDDDIALVCVRVD